MTLFCIVCFPAHNVFKGWYFFQKVLRILNYKMLEHYLSETFYKIELSLLLFELCRHEMLQSRWNILYLEQKYIGKIIIRLLIHQMIRKNITLIHVISCLYLVINNNCPNHLHMLLMRYFEKGWRDLPSHRESRFFRSISNDARYLCLSCFLTNHLTCNWVWSDQGNDKATLWHHSSDLKSDNKLKLTN